MNNTQKSEIIIEITEIINRKNKRKNSRREVVDVFNLWTTTYKRKIDDMNFLAWILSYIEDMLELDSDIVNEIVQIEKE